MNPKRRKKPARAKAKAKQKKASSSNSSRLRGLNGAAEVAPYSVVNFTDPTADPEQNRDITFEFLSGLIGIPTQPHDKRPDWARRACEEFWRSMGFRPAHPDEKHAGTLLGLISSMPTDLTLGGNGRGLVPLRAPLSDEGVKKRRTARSNSKPDPQLAMVQMVGETLLARLQQMPPRAWIFCMFVLRWRQVERFRSTSDLFDWLQSLWVEGRPLLAPTTDLREIRKICKLIGLRFGKRRS